MKKFSLEEYLANPDRKVVTRDGRDVRILATDIPGDSPIAAVVGDDKYWQTYTYLENGFTIAGTPQGSDLFFADEEEPLTEFEQAVCKYLDGKGLIVEADVQVDSIKEISAKLLDLARKELIPEFAATHYKEVMKAREEGKAEALKDLPRWKKAPKNTEIDPFAFVLFPDGNVGHSRFATEECYYIDPMSMLKLPKEE